MAVRKHGLDGRTSNPVPPLPRHPIRPAPLLKPPAPWGLAVYRADYRDDAAWRRMQEALLAHAAGALAATITTDADDAHHLLQRSHTAFLSDPVPPAAARRSDVRAHFARWAAAELRRNWYVTPDSPLPDLERARGAGAGSPGYRAGARYNFYLEVDAQSLRSLDSETPAVKIVRKDWSKEGWDESSSSSPSGVEAGYDSYLLPLKDYVAACRILLDPKKWYSRPYDESRNIIRRVKLRTFGRIAYRSILLATDP
ncbi:hypothetical protein PG997_011339 [Apiospora hydei]|uniref:Uncharacterized protein n=1 Tax=Apiospora hydei TaxID=1337664 RepID=A0ABR1VLG7_9PEZI